MTATGRAPQVPGTWWRLVCLLLGAVAAHGSAQTRGGPELYTQDDLLFLRHMIVHHEQALELVALVPSRTRREDLVRFARQVEAGQTAEIAQMESLLALAADRGMTVPRHDLHADRSMPGLLSKTRMDAIAAAKGAVFERLWLEGMIAHHEGALTMGRAQQRRQFESGRRPYGIDVLVDEILVAQRAEIAKMKGWLTEWGLSNRVRTSNRLRPFFSLRLADSQSVDHLRDALCLACQSQGAVTLVCGPDDAGQGDDCAGRVDIDAARVDVIVEGHL